MIRWIRSQRRATARRRRYAEITPLVFELRGLVVAALAASEQPAVMGHLLEAIDHLDAALRILAPDESPAAIIAIPSPKETQ